MATNTQINLALTVAGVVPEDQNCLTNVNDLLPVIAANMSVAAQDPQTPAAQNNSVADLALNIANNALSQIQAVQDSIPQRRTSGNNVVPIGSAGDNNVTITWNPEMPSINYAVYLTLHGPNTVNASNFNWWVIDQSRTVSSVQIRMVDVPAGSWSFTWEVIAL